MVIKGDIKSIIDLRFKDDYYFDFVWKFVELVMVCVNVFLVIRLIML